jgi:hypothetical protein
MPAHAFTFSSRFVALIEEAAFTKEMLAAGATQVRRANYATKGMYFQAFTSLSTGLERIGKLCLMLDHLLDKGHFPDDQFMRAIGHRVELIYQKTADVVARRKFQLEFLPKLQEPVHLAIVSILSEFGMGDRYSNINLLVGNPRSGDPMGRWHTEVDTPLFTSIVGERRKERIERNARLAEGLLGGVSTVLHISETGDMITTMVDGSRRTGVYGATAPYRQLYVLQIIRYWVEVLRLLEAKAAAVSDDIPSFEMFAIFHNDDSYLRTRKTFEKN